MRPIVYTTDLPVAEGTYAISFSPTALDEIAVPVREHDGYMFTFIPNFNRWFKVTEMPTSATVYWAVIKLIGELNEDK